MEEMARSQPMKKSEANRIAAAQLKEWMERNRDPGALPSIPVILISSLYGGKPGISINLCKNMPLTDVATILKAAYDQVDKTIKKLQENGN